MTTHSFDKDYWQTHWTRDREPGPRRVTPPHPCLAEELSSLEPGTALDAGCGEGAETIWLAEQGWQVTAADISSAVLEHAAERAAHSAVHSAVAERVEWVEADLSTWDPGRSFDLVTTFYAHAAMPQLDLYGRLAGWVAAGGTLLVVGHLHTPGTVEHGHADDGQPPVEATVTAASITATLDPEEWVVVTADELRRPVTDGAGRAAELHDVVVRATRR